MLHVRLTAFAFAAALSTPAFAWWDMGHMEIAEIAYKALTPAAKAKADALIKFNPDYQKWIAGAPAGQEAQYAFVHGATWPDDIKKQGSGYVRNKVTDPGAADNKGYADMVQHDYWHYVDIPFTTDSSPVKAPPVPNALTMIPALAATLASPGAADELKSFDLVWLEHLVGDVHQPLHGTTRFTKVVGDDTGGNGELIQVGTGQPLKLHLFWDGLFGDGTDVAGAIAAGDALPPADPAQAAISEPGMWLVESFAIAQTDVYVPAIGDAKTPFALPQSYGDHALEVAKGRAALAGARLAGLLNEALK